MDVLQTLNGIIENLSMMAAAQDPGTREALYSDDLERIAASTLEVAQRLYEMLARAKPFWVFGRDDCEGTDFDSSFIDAFETLEAAEKFLVVFGARYDEFEIVDARSQKAVKAIRSQPVGKAPG